MFREIKYFIIDFRKFRKQQQEKREKERRQKKLWEAIKYTLKLEYDWINYDENGKLKPPVKVFKLPNK